MSTAGHGEKFSRKRQQALAALVAEPTIERAARRCGVNARTLARWLKDDGFAAEYRAACRAVFETSKSDMQRLTGAAVRALRRQLARGRTGELQFRAAVAVWDRAARVIELDDLAERLAALEAKAGVQK